MYCISFWVPSGKAAKEVISSACTAVEGRVEGSTTIKLGCDLPLAST
jgi:hypothetical protein